MLMPELRVTMQRPMQEHHTGRGKKSAFFLMPDRRFEMQIGEVIRKYRKQKELTQEEMGERLGVTAPAVNKWENGASLR